MDVTIGELLDDARCRLGAASFQPAKREALLLLARVLERNEASILAHPEQRLPTTAVERFGELLDRRLAGEPVAYLFGEREFYGRPFTVDSRVLVPRPETEHLIEATLGLELSPKPRIVDIGTGSGAIAITLALEIPEARVLATDLSLAALRVASANVRRHDVSDRVQLIGDDLMMAVDLTQIDLMVSNPPYIDPAVAPELSPEVTAFEPHLALFAKDRGRAIIQRLLDETAELRPSAYLVIEIGHDQSEWLESEVRERSDWRLIRVVRDYGGIPRTALLRRNSRPETRIP